MARFQDFPHPVINVKDESKKDVFVSQDLPLHRPLFLSFAEKGEANVIQYGSYDEVVKKIGEGTFDEFSDYFKHPNLFFKMALQNQPAFFARLVPEDAVIASQVLEAHVWDADIPQWQRDVNGKYILTEEGDKIPIDANAFPVINSLQWSNWHHLESTTYELIIDATDPEGEDLTYEVTCDDASVVIEQNTVDNFSFDVTYPDYSTNPTEVNFTVTVTDAANNVTTSHMCMFVNTPTDDPDKYGYFFNNETMYGEKSYKMQFHGYSAGVLTHTLTCDLVGTTLTQDGTDPYKWDIILPSVTTDTPVEFTMTLTNDVPESIVMTYNITVKTNQPYQQLTEPGTMIRWETRPLESDEKINTLDVTTDVVGSDTITIYPILAFTPINGMGKFGNNMGIELYWSEETDVDTMIENEALLYKIAIYDKPYGVDTPIYVRDFYDSSNNDFAFKPTAIDTSINMRLDFSSIMNNNYRDKLPFNFHVYTDNVNTLGTRILALEDTTRISELTSSWMVNIFTAESTNEVPYYNLEIDIEDDDAALMRKGVIHYLTNGSDGTLSDENLEELTKLWLTGEVFPEVKDYARYPINHLYDSGYELDTKMYLINFLGIRKDVNIILSTQSVYEEPNTMAEDQSAGSSLRAAALLHPESILYGTQTCRVTIFQQCGYINYSTTYKNIVPLTLFSLYVRSIYHNADYIKNEWKGLPNSSVDLFNWINWSPSTDDVKQLSWDTGLNYAQFYDMTRFHYPDIISIYPFHTSVMSSDLFATYLVYLKQVVRETWAIFSGISESVTKLSGRIKKKLDPKLYYIFKEYMTIDTSIYQTDEDNLLGYAMTVELQVYDSVAKRVWNVPIKVRRIEDKE